MASKTWPAEFLSCILATLFLFLPTSLADEPKASLPELLKLYKNLGLPLPPNSAKLVRYKWGGRVRVNGKVRSTIYALAFENKRGVQETSPTFFTDTFKWEEGHEADTWEVAPDRTAVKDLVPDPRGQLVLAIRAYARGWNELAGVLLEESQRNADSSHWEDVKGAPQKRLIPLAWSYWAGFLTKPNLDRQPVAKRLRALIQEHKELDNLVNQSLLKSLELALVPSKAKPGSSEALIDRLVDYNGTTGSMSGETSIEDSSYLQIARFGFDAVPALIEHLDDERLTRGMIQGFNNFRSFNLRVQHVVSDLLEGLAGTGISSNWLRRQQGYALAKEDVRRWWETAQKEGEEAFLLKHFLDRDEDADGGRGERVREHRLLVIQVKYPRRIPELYLTVVDKHPRVNSFGLAEALRTSGVVGEREKTELYLHAIHGKASWHRPPAFSCLRQLDPKRFSQALIQSIESFPKDTDDPAYWDCSEARIAEMAPQCVEAAIWPLLEKVARRSRLGMKMEILHQVAMAGYPDLSEHRKERLILLSRFLDDKELRDQRSDPRLMGPGAGFPYERIEVRDAVALDLASLLNIKVDDDRGRKPEEWAKVRAQVRAGLKGEGINAP
jgi:hypothetical protein